VRNADVAGEVILQRGFARQRYQLQPLSSLEKPEILKADLDRFRGSAQRYFPVPACSPADAFVELAPQRPAFELLPVH